MASIISESDLPYSFLAILQIRVSSCVLTATGCLIWPDILTLKHRWSELELYISGLFRLASIHWFVCSTAI